MNVRLRRILHISCLTLLTAACSDDPTGPQDVADRAYELVSVDGDAVPVDIATYTGEQICVEAISGGTISFGNGAFDFNLGSTLTCGGDVQRLNERIQGQYVQQGERLEFDRDFSGITEISVGTVRGDRISVASARDDGVEMELGFRVRS